MTEMTYKEMSLEELQAEILRVKVLMKNPKSYFTKKQNTIYLEKLYKKERELKNGSIS